jgi:hypothetical protein
MTAIIYDFKANGDALRKQRKRPNVAVYYNNESAWMVPGTVSTED